ncbi:MAG: 16S rRNA (guanine(966)-N(2))-methyltransferase RsmD [Clostridiaceae bacterium]|nr:16S rRNA (guanine(966)-N(2))-methyltransferase RsmD [Clostridiaceae bacterium]
MRVISGSARGHKLKSPRGMATRPTSDRIKESLFNIIAAHVPGSYVLDLFAGTGALGIESLSRGAKFADFVEKNSSTARIISENLVHTKLSDRAKVHVCDWKDYINRRYNSTCKYDIIFMDPPYGKDFIVPVLKEIASKNMLNDDGMIIVERDNTDIIPDVIEDLDVMREQKYGRTVLTFIKKKIK